MLLSEKMRAAVEIPEPTGDEACPQRIKDSERGHVIPSAARILEQAQLKRSLPLLAGDVLAVGRARAGQGGGKARMIAGDGSSTGGGAGSAAGIAGEASG